MSAVRLTLLAVLWVSACAQAEPAYSVLSGQKCFLCHSNPSGSGIRSLYGSQFFAPTYLTVKPVSFELLDKVKPKLSESVTAGCDLRTIFLSENTIEDAVAQGLSAPLSTNTGNIAQMEGYLYLTFQPINRFLIYYSHGIASAEGHYEAWALADVLPFHGYVKAGQFQENYGWRIADHTSYVRTGLFGDYDGTFGGIPIAPHYGAGAEVGFRPSIGQLSASLTDLAEGNNPDARDAQKRWFVRGVLSHGIKNTGLEFSLGGSWFSAPQKAMDPEYGGFVSPRYEGWGGFGGIGWSGLENRFGCKDGFGFLTTCILFEYDRKAWTPYWEDYPVSSAYSTTTVSVQVQPGIWLKGAYDWMDNTGMADGQESERTTLGLQIYPIPWISIDPKYRLYSPLSAPGAHTRNHQLAELQMHVFF